MKKNKNMENNVVKLESIAKISNKAIELGKKVDDRLRLLNLANLVISEDNRKELKKELATLRKELTAFEEQKKAVKAETLAPFLEFEGVYDLHIKSKYSESITVIADAVSRLELDLLKNKDIEIRSYFDELCRSENIFFVKYESLNLKINLSTTIDAYKKSCNEFMDKVKSDLELINVQEHKSAILVEYKKTLNCSQSIVQVAARLEAIEKEKEAELLAKLKERHKRLIALGFYADKDFQMYVYSDDIHISFESAKNLIDKDFNVRLSELQIEINSLIAEKNKEVPESLEQKQVIKEPTPEPLKAPEQVQKQLKAKFEVVGTLSELKSVGAFMKSNNINYKNI